MHILITRPEPDATVWKTSLEARGAMVSIDSLLQIEMVPPPALRLDGVQALLVTSRNGLRGLNASSVLHAARSLPLYAVGPGTADLARDLGFETVHTGPASARDLVPMLTAALDPTGGSLLHLSGDKLAFDLAVALAPSGVVVDRLVVYRSRPASHFQHETVQALSQGHIDAVALTSPLSAQTFVTLCQQSNIMEQCQRLVYICLSKNIADGLQILAPRKILVAAQPNTSAMFTLIEGLANTLV